MLYSRLFELDIKRLVTILQQVRAAVPDLAVLAVGMSLYEEDAAALREQLDASNLQDLLTDVGWQDEAVLPHVLAAADVGIFLMDDTLLNRTKCPVKLADLLSVGTPVVAEAVGQVSEYVVNGLSGCLRESGDVDGLIFATVKLLQNKPERMRMAEESRAHYAAHFAWERLAARLEYIYKLS